MWRRRKETDNSFNNTIAKIIAATIIRLQQKTARKLQAWEGKYSIHTKKRMLAIGFTCCAAYCLYLLASAFFHDDRRSNNLLIKQGDYASPVIPSLGRLRNSMMKKGKQDSAAQHNYIIKP